MVHKTRERTSRFLLYIKEIWDKGKTSKEVCVAEIEAGKILIIVVDEMKIGHAPLNEVVRPVLTNDKKENLG